MVNADDHLGGAQLCQAMSAGFGADRGDYVSARARGELYGEAPHAARGAGDQHASTGHGPQSAQGL